jgi:hypothetical protein
MMRRHTIITVLLVPAFAAGGALSRYDLRTTETRWQIAAFVALAVSAELIARMSGTNRASILRGTLNAAAAAIVIVSMKFHLEPAARKHDSAIVRHVSKTVVNAIADTQ